jgi:hypothetical protein
LASRVKKRKQVAIKFPHWVEAAETASTQILQNELRIFSGETCKKHVRCDHAKLDRADNPLRLRAHHAADVVRQCLGKPK